MLKETETKKQLFFVTFLSLVAFQLSGFRPPGPPGYAYVKRPGPPGTILLLGAHLNWGPFKYYCTGHFLIGWQKLN